jgi:hypothetical protein
MTRINSGGGTSGDESGNKETDSDTPDSRVRRASSEARVRQRDAASASMDDKEVIRSQLQKVVENVRDGGDGDAGDRDANGSNEQRSDTGQRGRAPEQQADESGATGEGSRLERSLTAAERDLEERIDQNDDPSPERARRRRQALSDIRKRLQRTQSGDDDSETREQNPRIRDVVGNAFARTEADIVQAATGPVAAVRAQQQRGAGLPENPNDPFEAPSPAERDLPPREDLAEQVADSSDELDKADIAGFNETEDGEFEPVLTADAQEDLVVESIAEQDPRIGEEDIIGVQETDSGEFQAVLDPEVEEGLAREQIAAEDPRISEEDIIGVDRTGDGAFQPELSDEARLEIARDEFEIERDTQRLFAGTERVPLYLDEQDFTLGIDEDGEIQAELNEQGRQELRERQAREAAPFVGKYGEEDRVEEFLTDAQQTQFERAERDEEPEGGIARAPVPYTDQDVIDVLDAGAESVQTNIVSPAADLAGESAEMTATEPSTVEVADGVEVQSDISPDQNRALAEGAVQGVGAVANLPGVAADTLRLGETFREVQGDPEAQREVGEVAALTGARFAEFSVEEPVRAAGTIGGGIATSVGGGRAIQRSATRLRNARVRGRVDTVVDFEDLTSRRGIEGELPEFKTPTSAPTADAVGEVRRRAADQPDDLQRAGEMTLSEAVGFEAGRRVGRRVGAVEDAAHGAGQRVGGRLGDLDDTAFEAGRRLGDRLGEVDDAAFRTGEWLGSGIGRAEDATLGRLDRAAFGAGERVGRGTRRLEDATVGRASRAASSTRQRVDARLGDLDDTAFPTGRRVGESITKLEAGTFDRLDDAAFDAGARVGGRLADLDDSAFALGELVGQRLPKGSDITAGPLARAQERAFQAGRRLGDRLGEVDDAAFRTGEWLGSGIGEVEDHAFRLGRSAGDRLGEVDDAAFRAGQRAGRQIGRVDDAVDSALAPVTEPAFRAGERAGAFVSRVEERAENRGPIGESVLLRSEDDPLDEEFTAQRGEFELPGLFASPDLSPLRLTTRRSNSLSLGLPRVRGPGEQVTAFPGDRIEGMPRRAAESGFESGPGGRRPDPETGGARFLEGEAKEGTAYVRATGDRSAELEAIFPPGSKFTQQSEFAVRMPDGRLVPGSLFKRRGTPGDSDVDVPEEGGGDLFAAEELPSTRISRADDTTPVYPPFASGTGSSASTGGRSSVVDEDELRASATSPSGGVGDVTESSDLPPATRGTFDVSGGSSSGPSRAGESRVGGFSYSGSSGPASKPISYGTTATAQSSITPPTIDIPTTSITRLDPEPDLDGGPPPEQLPERIGFDEVFSSGIVTGAEAAQETFGDGGFGELDDEMSDFEFGR